jgi:hypothetical protein
VNLVAASDLTEIWREKPMIIVMLAVGFAVFLFVVIDAHRHKKRRNGKGPRH